MSRLLRLPILGIPLLAGCVKQDTEILNRVARGLGQRAQESTAPLRDRFPFRIVATGEPSLADSVRQRLASDALLTGTTFEVAARGGEVEVRGTVAQDEQKRRAVDLAQSTRGVENVLDRIEVR